MSTNVLQLALLVAVIVTTVMDYLKRPLVETPKIADWMVKAGLAYIDDDGNLCIWFIPYVTFVLGFLVSWLLEIDLISSLVTVTVVPIIARILTAIIVGGGSNMIHEIVAGRR